MTYRFSPSMQSTPYYWARTPWLYVKWGKPASGTIPSVRRYGKTGSWFLLPDREIIICHESERPSHVDEALDLNPWSTASMQDVDYFLLGQGSGRRIGPSVNWHKNPKVKVIADSGGAQLRSGSRWFAPEKSLEFINHVGDIGMVLDIPSRTVDLGSETDLASTQAYISDWFLKNKRSDLKLLNIAHGNDIQTFSKWVEIVDRPYEFMGWATGEPWQLAWLAGHYNMSHLHALGSGSVYPYLAWLGKLVPNQVTVTSDSSTWSMVFRSSNIPFPRASCGSFEYAMMGGDKRFVKHPSHTHGRVSCNCPVCSRIGWFFPFTNARGQDLRYMVAIHVLYNQFVQASKLNELARTSKDVEDYVDKVVKLFGGVSPGNNSKHAQKRGKDGLYPSHKCPFCGKDADKGRGDFPHCRRHRRVANYISEIYVVDTVYNDPSILDYWHREDAKQTSMNTHRFGLKKLFGAPEKLFSRQQGTHMSSMESKTSGASLLMQLSRYKEHVDELAKTCHCHQPVLKLKGPTKGRSNPTTPPFTATCTQCQKPFELPKKGLSKGSKHTYTITLNGTVSSEEFATVKEALTRINQKYDEFVQQGGEVSQLAIQNGTKVLPLKVSTKGRVTTSRTCGRKAASPERESEQQEASPPSG
jgi:hypothetical protein